MKRISIIIMLSAAATCFGHFTSTGQTKEGSIDRKTMEQIKQGYTASDTDKAMRNALSSSDIRKVAVNMDNKPRYDTHFNIKVPTRGVTDQKKSGRCWLFSSLNVLRAEVIGKYDLDGFEFSEAYGQFYDLLEKSNMFLENVIAFRKEPIDSRTNTWLFKKPFGDGGHFANAANVIAKYGAVPKEIMPETYASSNNANLMSLLWTKCRQYGLALRADSKATRKNLEALKVEGLTEIYRLLVLNLGVPPEEFVWTLYDKSGKAVGTETYTPLSFYDKMVGRNIRDEYVMFMNDPTHDYYRLYEVDLNRNSAEGDNWKYINLPMEELEKIALASLRGGKMLYFSCDVDKFRLPEMGLLDTECYDYRSALGVDFPMDKRARIESCESTSTHAMALAGADTDPDGNVRKWLVENSYGPDYGFKGFLIMTNKWFEEYMFRLVAEKQYVPQDILKILDTRSTVLPAWNPAFLSEDY